MNHAVSGLPGFTPEASVYDNFQAESSFFSEFFQIPPATTLPTSGFPLRRGVNLGESHAPVNTFFIFS